MTNSKHMGLWLKVTRSNNSPVFPASYNQESVSKWNLVPYILGTDCGNETCLMVDTRCKLLNNINAHR